MNVRDKFATLERISLRWAIGVKRTLREAGEDFVILLKRDLIDNNKSEIPQMYQGLLQSNIKDTCGDLIDELGNREIEKVKKIIRNKKQTKAVNNNPEVEDYYNEEELSNELNLIKNNVAKEKSEALSQDLMYFLLTIKDRANRKFSSQLEIIQRQIRRLKQRTGTEEKVKKLEEDLQERIENKNDYLGQIFMSDYLDNIADKALNIAENIVYDFDKTVQNTQVDYINKKKVGYYKRWYHDAIINEFSRPGHVAQEGVTKEIGEPFILQNPKTLMVTECQYPREPGMPASESKNCKCLVEHEYYLI